MTVPAEIIVGLGSAKTLSRNVIVQYQTAGDLTKSTCWGSDRSAYVGLDVTVKADGPGTLMLDGQTFAVPAGGISMESVYYDQVKWVGGAATITLEGTTFPTIQAQLGAPTPRGANVEI